jgi:hypothetical protein
VRDQPAPVIAADDDREAAAIGLQRAVEQAIACAAVGADDDEQIGGVGARGIDQRVAVMVARLGAAAITGEQPERIGRAHVGVAAKHAVLVPHAPQLDIRTERR